MMNERLAHHVNVEQFAVRCWRPGPAPRRCWETDHRVYLHRISHRDLRLDYPTSFYYHECLASTLERRRLWTAFQVNAQIALAYRG